MHINCAVYCSRSEGNGQRARVHVCALGYTTRPDWRKHAKAPRQEVHDETQRSSFARQRAGDPCGTSRPPRWWSLYLLKAATKRFSSCRRPWRGRSTLSMFLVIPLVVVVRGGNFDNNSELFAARTRASTVPTLQSTKALRDIAACRRYATRSESHVETRIASERAICGIANADSDRYAGICYTYSTQRSTNKRAGDEHTSIITVIF